MTHVNPVEKIIADHQAARSLEDSNADICFLALSVDEKPSVRTLVLREISAEGFTLFINKTSPKWHIIEANSEAEILLWYSSVQRQYRITGHIEELGRAAIEKNWPRRPAGSKYLDHAYTNFGPQSTEIESRQALVDHIGEFRVANPEDTLTTPDIATGIILRPTTIEYLDLNHQDRVHDRKRYTVNDGKWTEAQLMP